MNRCFSNLRIGAVTPVMIAMVLSVESRAAITVYNSANVAGNSAMRISWLAGIGVTPQHLVNFESGFIDGQNINGASFVGGMQIRDSGTGTPTVSIESTAGGIGGSNPVGIFSIEHDEQPFLILDFSAQPVDYIGLFEIDTTRVNYNITFVGGGTFSFSSDTTGGSGDSGEFIGFHRNDQPKITMVEMDASGDGVWGVDNFEYGGVPEPSSILLLAMGMISLGRRKR